MNTTRRLGLLALTLGVAAPFVGNPARAARGRVDVSELAAIVMRGEDHVDAIELARWIRQGKAQLRIVDLRSEEEFKDYAIPGARNIAIDAIERTAFDLDETIVLYSGSGVHAGQAWVFLRAIGVHKVFFLRGGLAEWMDDVVNMTLEANATPERKLAFERDADLSRYFGGTPQLAEEGASGVRVADPVARAAEAVRQKRRRGC